MANLEHLQILNQGVEAWNKWLDKRPEIRPNLCGANLRKADLSDANLLSADLEGANLSGANLRNACLIFANLSGADLRRSDLRSATLFSADMSEADIRFADLSHAKLSLAILVYAKLDKAIIHQAKLWGIQREHWSIKGVRCDSVYWDEEAKTLTHYKPGDFERLFSDKAKLQLFYKDGLNALEIVGKKIGEVKLATSGAGAAGIACLDMLVALGMKPEHILAVDRDGVLYTGRPHLDPDKARYARDTGKRTLAEIVDGADIFLGLSAGGVACWAAQAPSPDLSPRMK